MAHEFEYEPEMRSPSAKIGHERDRDGPNFKRNLAPKFPVDSFKLKHKQTQKNRIKICKAGHVDDLSLSSYGVTSSLTCGSSSSLISYRLSLFLISLCLSVISVMAVVSI